MSSFRDLLAPTMGSDFGDPLRLAALALPDRVKQSPMDWWPLDAMPNGTGNRLLVGVAVPLGYDLNLLDLLEEAIRGGRGDGLPVGVFDIDSLPSLDELERLLPGIGIVSHTPVVGHWVCGKLKQVASGYQGRQLVGQLFGFDPQLALERFVATSG